MMMCKEVVSPLKKRKISARKKRESLQTSKNRALDSRKIACKEPSPENDAANDDLSSSDNDNSDSVEEQTGAKTNNSKPSEEVDMFDCLYETFGKLSETVGADYCEYLQKLYRKTKTSSKLKRIFQSAHGQNRPSPSSSSPVRRTRNQQSATQTRNLRSKGQKKPSKVKNSEAHSEVKKAPTEDPQSFDCDICGAKFKTKRYSTEHSVKVHGLKRFKCLVCEERFLHKPEMYQHLKSHVGPNGLQCPVCLKLYQTSNVFLQHMNRVHLNDVKLPCSECGVVFRSAWLLKSHSLVHTKKQRFVCQICDKGFPVKTWYMDHINVHSGLKPYKCEHCQKCYRSQPMLRDHKKKHNSGSKYICLVCQKSFITASLLNKHARVHESHKNFECGECGMKFKLPQTLVSHKRVHKGDYSSKQYSSKNDMLTNGDISSTRTSILNENNRLNADQNDDSDDNDSDESDYDDSNSDNKRIIFTSPLDSIEINKNPLDFSNGLFDILKDDSVSESDSEDEVHLNSCSADAVDPPMILLQNIDPLSIPKSYEVLEEEHYHLALSESSSEETLDP